MYQCDVSVWVALDLMLVQDAAKAVQLEPATFEDVEVELAERDPVVVRLGRIERGQLVVVEP